MRDNIALLLMVGLGVLVVVVAASLVVSSLSNDNETAESRMEREFERQSQTSVARDQDLTRRAEAAEGDASRGLPGKFVPSQGAGHYDGRVLEVLPPPFCEDVVWSGVADAITASPVPIVPISPGAPSTYYRGPMEGGEDCYKSNPPSSGRHTRVERNVEISAGTIIDIPPDPSVYSGAIAVPRAAIPHILEHAGVFVGYHCADSDDACEDVVSRLADVVNQRIDEDDRVVMARDTDLPVGEIGLAAWTRVLNMRYQDFDEDAVIGFITVHSCRYDPEGFCP